MVVLLDINCHCPVSHYGVSQDLISLLIYKLNNKIFKISIFKQLIERQCAHADGLNCVCWHNVE